MDVSKVLDKNGRFSGKRAKLYPEVVQYLKSIHDTPAAAIWILNSGAEPLCICGAKVNWKRNDFFKFCSVSCASKTTSKHGSEHHLSKSRTRQKIRETNLQKYGVENPMQLDEVKAKSKSTCQVRYGASTFLGSEAGKNAWQKGVDAAKGTSLVRVQTSIARYGVEHPSQNSVIKKRTAEQKNRNTVSRILGANSSKIEAQFDVDNYSGCGDLHSYKCLVCQTLFEARLKRADKIRCFECEPKLVGTSKLEKDFGDWIQSLGVNVVRNDRTKLGKLEIDILVPDFNLGIEINGNYWHSVGSDEVQSDKMRCITKTLLAAERGIRLIHITEDELVSKNEIAKSRVLVKLGLANRVFARKCKIEKVDKKLAKAFFEHTHIQGAGRLGECFALYLDNEIVACASVGKARFTTGFELLRFSTKLNTTVIGGLSRLTKAIRKQINEPIISYADRRWGDGSGYEAAGFTLVSVSGPSFCFIHPSQPLNRIGRSALQKKRLASKGTVSDGTAIKQAYQLGYRRLWDCGTTKWVL